MQIFTQACILTSKLLIFFFEWIALGLQPAFLRSQRFADAQVTFPPPDIEERGVQALPAEQRAHATACSRSGFGFLQVVLFIFSGVGPPLWFGNHFGVKMRGRTAASARFGCRCTALRLVTLAFALFRNSQTPRTQNTKRIPGHLSLFLSRPAH